MTVLRLNDPGTRQVLVKHQLTADRRIGRGAFCAVYEDGPTSVLKLSSDSVQLDAARHYLEGVHYPKMVEDIGYVGTQLRGDIDLVLFKAERLNPTRLADAATRKLARKIQKSVFFGCDEPAARAAYSKRGTQSEKNSARSLVVLQQLVDNKSFPISIHEAFLELQRLAWDYSNLFLDFAGANLMVRGTDELVFNDVFANGDLFFAE